MQAERLDAVRAGVLAQMQRAQRNMRLAMLGAAAVELVLFAVALRMVDMSNRLERLVFVLSILSYTIVVLGLMKFLSWTISLGSGTAGGTLAPVFTIGVTS